MARTQAIAVAVLVGAGGCTDEGATADATSVQMMAPAVEVGLEDTVCATVRLDNADEMWVSAIHATLSRGSHHMIVYRSTATEEAPEPVPCTPFSDIIGGTTPLMIVQQEEASVVYPEGVAIRLEPRQMVKLELHYINVYDETIDVVGDVEFEEAEGSPAALIEADFLFWGTRDIEIAPRSDGMAQRYFPMSPYAAEHAEPMQIFGVTSHMHARGTRATVERATGLDDPTDLLHVSMDWAEPPLDTFDPPLVLGDDEGLLLTCEYTNESDETVRFGEGFYDEMCFLWAYYYPSQGFLVAL